MNVMKPVAVALAGWMNGQQPDGRAAVRNCRAHGNRGLPWHRAAVTITTMNLRLHFCLGFAFASSILTLSLLPVSAAETEWPNGCELAENSTSPNERYAVIIPSRESADVDDGNNVDELVDLRNHKILGPISGAHYSAGRNHQGLSVYWAPDSSWCAVVYLARFGFEGITLVDLHGDKMVQHQVGRHIQMALDGVIGRLLHDKQASCDAMAFFRPGKNREVLLRGFGDTNPKSLPDAGSCCAYFEGVFDLAPGKWSNPGAARESKADSNSLMAVLGDGFDQGTGSANEDDSFKRVDDFLNSTYAGLRAILSAESFARVRMEEIAWVKQRDALGTPAEKIEFTVKRIESLQELAWH